MTTISRLGCAAILLTSVGPALAEGSHGVQVSGSVTQACQINAGSSSIIDLTGLGVNVAEAGVFEYQCNFAGGNTIINIKSDNGGLKNGLVVANYGVFLNDQTPAALGAPNPVNWVQASSLTGGGVPFFNITVPSAANTPKLPYFYVGLTQPTPVAGTYTDVLTFTISP